MSELDRSIDYFRKVCMVKENIVPTQTEVKYRMGDDLAQVLFDSILPALKPYLGVCPPLNGPGNDLWLSPSDLLIGKVKLKPPLTSKHIKALTHEGILDIGHLVEQKRDYEYQLDKEKALIEKEMIIKYVAAKELREAVARAKEEKDKEQKAIVEKLQEDFKEELKYELEHLTDKLKIEQDIAVEVGKREKEEEMQIKLDLAVHETVCNLTEQFARELYKVSKKMHGHFWYHIRKEKKKLKEAILFERMNGAEKLEQLRAELHCENVANIMYILAAERRRCICEKQAIENNFIARLALLEKEQEDRNEKLVQAIKRYEVAGHKIKVREAILFDIIKQFQKFIYFVLRAVPMQAEYLLNVEQLMIFELTRSVIDTKPELFASEDGEEKEQRDTTLEPESRGDISHIASSGIGGNVTEIDASKYDYHNCDNVSRCDSIDKSLKENEDLPYFLFNENLYVREDFRNMISQGIKISKSHELWSFRNEEVIQQIMPRTTFEKRAHSFSMQERMSMNQTESGEVREQKKSIINVRFSALNRAKLTEEEKLLETQTYEEAPIPLEPVEKQKAAGSVDSTESIELAHKKRPSKLVLARDSVELLVQKSANQICRESKVLGVKTKNSFQSNAQKSIDGRLLTAKDLIRNESKLELHRDSLELLKESTLNKSSSDTKPDVCTKRQRSIGIQCDSIHKTVAISHIEIIPDDSKRKVSVVSFQSVPRVIPDEPSVSEEILKMEPFYQRPPTEDRKYRQPEKAFRIIGDKDMKEYLMQQDEFTARRVQSFIRIFKNDPSLRDLFTEATKN